MVEQKTMNYILIIMILGGIGINYTPEMLDIMFQETQYFCPDRPELGFLHCDGFSQYYGSPFGKCLNATGDFIISSNKVCRGGFTLVEDDRVDINENISSSYSDSPVFILENQVDYKSLKDVRQAAEDLEKEYPSADAVLCNSEKIKKCCVVIEGVIQKNKCKDIKSITELEATLGVV